MYVFTYISAQPKATQFDKFINKPEIEWAVYLNDTVRFENMSLNKILLQRLAKNEIKASLPLESGTAQADNIKYLKKNEIDLTKFRFDEIAVFDSMGNITKTIKQLPRFDTSKFAITDVIQVMYIENGQLRSYLPWVSPMMPVVTSTGVYLGQTGYFSTCFNFNYKYRSPKQDKIILLSRTVKKISLDSFDVRNKLKELYGRNPVQTLWPYILQNKITVFDAEKNTRLKPEELTIELVDKNRQAIIIPIYDSVGTIARFDTTRKDKLNPDVFTSVELVQDWYYDQSSNIVFATTREMYLYSKQWAVNPENTGIKPILKIVFQ
jgi:hypothetical protein